MIKNTLFLIKCTVFKLQLNFRFLFVKILLQRKAPIYSKKKTWKFYIWESYYNLRWKKYVTVPKTKNVNLHLYMCNFTYSTTIGIRYILPKVVSPNKQFAEGIFAEWFVFFEGCSLYLFRDEKALSFKRKPKIPIKFLEKKSFIYLVTFNRMQSLAE